MDVDGCAATFYTGALSCPCVLPPEEVLLLVAAFAFVVVVVAFVFPWEYPARDN